MKYLKSFENRAYGSNYVSILDEDIEKYLPKKWISTPWVVGVMVVVITN